ncbi:MAG: aminotransferase class V-fold PLP-dependent enzyme [Gemmatimonadetes bacterium]|jgi:UDP-sulfoquinovose synthase|nr:aminotransferase class V-fold PLP-dependent enzyme [Gemmatimonadota bacterium]
MHVPRKLDSIRTLDAERGAAAIAYNPGTMTDPLPAVERAMAAFRRRVRGRPLMAYDKCRQVLHDMRLVAADVLGGVPEGWAMADGHTATIDRIAASLAAHLGPGARVVSTDSEHVGGIGAFSADPRFVVAQVPVEQLAETPADIYFLSHVTYDTNHDNAAVIRALTSRPDRPIVIVDGNQAVGQIPVDVATLDCDAYLTSTHKWLGGPHGGGLLYLRQEALASWPSPFHAGEPLVVDLPIGWWEPRGGQDFSRVAGIAAAVRAYQVHARPGAAIRARFVSALREALGDRVHPLASSTEEGRVVAFELIGIDVYPIYRELAERGLSIKCIKKPGKRSEASDGCLEVLRVGFPWWTDEAQVDDAVRILGDVVDGMTPGSLSGSGQRRRWRGRARDLAAGTTAATLAADARP